jgi:hypothetical protein
MVCHEREAAEHPGLYGLIETSVRTEERTREVQVMRKSMPPATRIVE